VTVQQVPRDFRDPLLSTYHVDGADAPEDMQGHVGRAYRKRISKPSDRLLLPLNR
jgi:hypothetical protein